MCTISRDKAVPGLDRVADEIYRASHLARGVQMAVSDIDAEDHRKALEWMLNIVLDGLEAAIEMLKKHGVDCDD